MDHLVPKHHNEPTRGDTHGPTVLPVQNLMNLRVGPNSKLVHVIKLVEYETSHRPVSDMWAQRLDESGQRQRVNVRWGERHGSLDDKRTYRITCILAVQMRFEFVLTFR